MAVILLGIAVTVLDGMISNLALPAIVRDLRTTPSAAVWVVNAYQLATLAVLLPLATLGDRWGYRRVYLGGVALFTLASAACALAPSLPALAVARAFQGMGAAGLMAVNPALVRLTYPRATLGRGIALNSVVVAVASVAGPTVAAAVLSLASWPWLFAINVPLGLVLMAVGRKALPFNPPRSAAAQRLVPLDVLLNAAMFCLLFLGVDLLGAREGGPTAASAAGGWVLAGGLLIAVVHVRRQVRLATPLLPIDLLRIPIFRLSMGSSFGAFTAQSLSFIALPFLLLEVWHLDTLHAGLLMACWPVGVMMTAPVAGRLIGRVPGGLLGAIGLGLLGTGLAALAWAAGRPSAPPVWWCLVLCGIGFALFQSPNNHIIMTSPPPHRTGAAGGMLATARLTGQSTGAVCIAIVFALAGLQSGLGPQVALAIASAMSLVGAVSSGLRLRV